MVVFLPTSLPEFQQFLEGKKRCINSCYDPQSGTQLSSTLTGLQAEKELLQRSLKDQENEMNSLRQQAHLHQSSLEQERQRSSIELGNLHAQLQHQVLRCVDDSCEFLLR